MPPQPPPPQSGVGNIANAVLAGPATHHRGRYGHTEVLEDGMLRHPLESGAIRFASATAFSLSPAGLDRSTEKIARFKESILPRPEEISNHPEVIRRLGVPRPTA